MALNWDLVGGTLRQREWFLEAVNLSPYDWEQVPGSSHVLVTWVVDPEPDMAGEFAYATPVLGGTSTIEIVLDLDNPNRRQPAGWAPGTFGGRPFYHETVMHEIGHIMMMFWGEDRIEEAKDIFRSNNWNDGPWETQVVEACAECWKDLYAHPDLRRYFNRTRLKLRKADFKRFAALWCP